MAGRDLLRSDSDADGLLSEEGVGRIFGLARAAYFALCQTVYAGSQDVEALKVQPGEAVSTDTGATVATNVVEVYPDRFTMTAVIRKADDAGRAATAWCSLNPGGPVTDAIRDEFIALAHGATRTH